MKILLIIFAFFLNLYSFDFKLKPIKINENSFYFYGKEEYFSKENGGDISNSTFIITKNSVILIDTGTSVDYANQVKEEIAKITKNPVKYVINTHHHPDHFLGNKAFDKELIYATNETREEIKNNGELYVSNMVNLIGKTIYSTRAKAPNKELHSSKLVLDGYELDILYFHGHTKSDIAILDKNTKTLYTSDLIFNKRALATPHANLKEWIKSLEAMKKLDFKTLVPGHGKVSLGKDVIDENINYLKFVDTTLKNAIDEGLDIFEILAQDIPDEIKNYSMFKEEFERSVINLYKKYELNY